MTVIKRHWVMIVFLAVGSMGELRADEVPTAYRVIAQENGLPAPLFYAVALAESGQSRLSEHKLRPWPWTLNVNGQGQYFATREAAWRALQTALANDEGSVDIGLLQINWRYHQQALGSAWQALDPYHNLRVGAEILRQCYAKEADWWDSLGCYHAPNDPVRAQQYRDRVTRYWRQVTKEHER